MAEAQHEATRGRLSTPVAARTLRVAAVQMPSADGAIALNLERATGHVEEAVRRGARLVLLPELMPSGYLLSPRMWKAGETADGPTARWLAEQSSRLGVFLGTSFLEVEGDDFYNTFVLTTPEGREAGRVRKETPAIYEAFFTRGGPGPHVIETEIGRIGVGICYENQLAYMPRLCVEHAVDLVLMPHSAPSPRRSNRIIARRVDVYEETLRTIAPWYAENLGVPVVMANKCGPWRSPVPMMPLVVQDSAFPGLSTIADSDGRVLVQLDGREDVVVEDVVLDAERKKRPAPRAYGHWARKVPWSTELLRLVEAVGSAAYSLRRAQRGRAARHAA